MKPIFTKARIGRIKAVLVQELYITKASVEIFSDVFWFPVMSVIALGFIDQYFSSRFSEGHIVTIGYLYWEYLRIAQYTIAVGIMWNIWSHNLSNMFISGLSMKEYFATKFFAATIVAAMSFTVNAIATTIFFKFNPFSIGITNSLLNMFNLGVFGWSLGIIICAVIFRFGTRIQAITWGLIYMIQPVTAPLFPLSVLPVSMQRIAVLIPPTHVFEAARFNIAHPEVIRWDLFMNAAILNIIYVGVAIAVFIHFYDKSRMTGQFAKNDQQ